MSNLSFFVYNCHCLSSNCACVCLFVFVSHCVGLILLYGGSIDTLRIVTQGSRQDRSLSSHLVKPVSQNVLVALPKFKILNKLHKCIIAALGRHLHIGSLECEPALKTNSCSYSRGLTLSHI